MILCRHHQQERDELGEYTKGDIATVKHVIYDRGVFCLGDMKYRKPDVRDEGRKIGQILSVSGKKEYLLGKIKETTLQIGEYEIF